MPPVVTLRNPVFCPQNVFICVVYVSELGVFGNRVLRRIFVPKRDKVTREWRKLHNEELNFLYASTDIVQVIKSRRMGWLGHVASMGRGEVHTGFW